VVFLVKLDTNGNKPEVIKQALAEGVVDYIAMDVKTSLALYPCLVGNLVSTKNIAESVECIMKSGIPYEFRSTLIKETHSPKTVDEMADLIAGADRLFLQTFRPDTTLEPLFAEYHPFSDSEMVAVADIFKKVVKEVVVR
jgi:pyruvate formate lyase activating enzyme